MSTPSLELVDAIVLGANIRGLVTAYLLNELGYSSVLIERGRNIGGADGSFVTERGTRFDTGLHVLDFGRSELATRLFSHVVDGRVHRVRLDRGLVMAGQIMPYAAEPSALPPSIRSLLSGDTLVDEIGSELPTRARLGQAYGPAFADLIYEQVLPAYRSEQRHMALGVDPARLLTNIYPWFFPRAQRPISGADASRAFHDKLRAGITQEVLYPEEGGFGGFARGFLDKLDPGRTQVLLGAGEVSIQVRAGSHDFEWVEAAGRRFRARHYFWAGPWPALCRLLNIPFQDPVSDRVLLGSFAFDRALSSDYIELLVGDPRHPINRIHFPARFRASDEPLLQVEMALPLAESPSLDPARWRAQWLESLEQLGIIGRAHQVVDFDFRSFAMHFNSFGVEGQPLIDADAKLIAPGSNVFPIVPSMANLNLNRYVPQAVADVSALLARDGS